MKFSKKIISVLLALLLLTLTVPFAFAADPEVKTVTYLDANGEKQSVEAAVVVPGAPPYGAAGETNWYVIEGTYNGNDVISTYDAVSNFILADDADWTITNTGTFNLIAYSGSVNLFAQENGAGTLTLSSRIAPINGDLTIYGGNITTPALHASTSVGTTAIYGGVINTDAFYTKNLLVAGGEIHAKSTMSVYGALTVSGGEIEVLQPNAGGSMALMSQGNLLITGGTVTSSGQNGLYSQTGSVTITGGTVTATGSSMGISASTGIFISGGNVTATGTNTMGLMTSGPISVTGGTVSATGGVFGVYASAQDAVVTLGTDKPDSSYTFSNFFSGCTVAVQDGQTLTDGENDYCGTLTADEVAALAGKTLVCKHAWGWVVDKDATCGEAGAKHEVCAVCGAVQSENTVIPATGEHVTEIVNATEATATQDGYTGDEVCTVCGQTIQTGETIPATGEPETPDEPDIPDDGKICPYCHKTHTGKFARWTYILHLILWFFMNTFHILKK